MVSHHDVLAVTIDAYMERLPSGVGVVLHRILHEYLYRHRENQMTIVLQFFLYLKHEMLGMSDVEQIAVFSDEVDFLGDGNGLLVQLVHDVAIDGGELQGESLGKLWVFADEFGDG